MTLHLLKPPTTVIGTALYSLEIRYTWTRKC